MNEEKHRDWQHGCLLLASGCKTFQGCDKFDWDLNIPRGNFSVLGKNLGGIHNILLYQWHWFYELVTTLRKTWKKKFHFSMLVRSCMPHILHKYFHGLKFAAQVTTTGKNNHLLSMYIRDSSLDRAWHGLLEETMISSLAVPLFHCFFPLTFTDITLLYLLT